MEYIKKHLGLVIGLVILAAVIFWGITTYNKMIVMSNKIDTQWAQVDSVLQRRFDSINQAIGGLKIANKNEQDALQKITDARKLYMASQGDTEAQVAAANNFAGSLNGILLSRGVNGTEAYPNLKTPELVGGLVSGLNIEGNENRINIERQRYNEYVNEFNNTIMTFPSNVIAKVSGFKNRTLFKIESEARNAPNIAPNLEF